MKYPFLKLILFLVFILNTYCNFVKENIIITLTKDNTVYINDEINEESISKAIYKIVHTKDQDIYIYIDSFGGNVKQGNRFIEVIEYYSKKKKIYCIATYAASMAFIILQKCPFRYATSTSILMQHNIKVSSIDNNNKNIKNYVEYVDDLENYLIEQQIKRINMEKNKFIELVRNDWWISGNQAIKINVIDKLVIVGCDTKIDDTYELTTYETINNNMMKIIKIFSYCPLIKKPISIIYNKL